MRYVSLNGLMTQLITKKYLLLVKAIFVKPNCHDCSNEIPFVTIFFSDKCCLTNVTLNQSPLVSKKRPIFGQTEKCLKNECLDVLPFRLATSSDLINVPLAFLAELLLEKPVDSIPSERHTSDDNFLKFTRDFLKCKQFMCK